jgi:hypothetical protein
MVHDMKFLRTTCLMKIIFLSESLGNKLVAISEKQAKACLSNGNLRNTCLITSTAILNL